VTLSTAQRQSLLALDVGTVQLDEPMSRHTSFRIGGPVDAYVRARDSEALQRLLSWCHEQQLPVMTVGGGCNLLVRDGGIRGVVVRLGKGFRRLRFWRDPDLDQVVDEGGEVDAISRFSASVEAVDFAGDAAATEGTPPLPVDDDGLVRVHSDSGVVVPTLLRFCVRWGLGGVEGLGGVPGTVGGALVMNAGTHEGEVGDVVEEMYVVTSRGEAQTLRPGDFRFEYRKLHLPSPVLIVGALMALRPRPSAEVQQEIRDLVSYRKRTQPTGLPSAGCLFKNPPGAAPAGKLIDDAGLKGLRVGGACVSDVHANYVVNDGKATAADVLDLMSQVKERVLSIYDVDLDPEVRVIGSDPQE
jgi:UDP-N-acetylmuramate dehydrogenase